MLFIIMLTNIDSNWVAAPFSASGETGLGGLFQVAEAVGVERKFSGQVEVEPSMMGLVVFF